MLASVKNVRYFSRFMSGFCFSYQPFELCNLEYERSRLSGIEFHQDDMWIWGERLISVNLLAGSVMTLVRQRTNECIYVPMPRR